MYLKDLKHHLSIRLNAEQKEFIENEAKNINISNAEYIRKIINIFLYADKGDEIIENI